MSDHRPQLDGLRAIAVAGVLYAHYVNDETAYGHLGVRLFFVLSGFLITQILLDLRGAAADGQAGRALKVFYLRRALRIFPAYYALLALLAVIGMPGVRESLPWSASYLMNFRFAALDELDPAVLAHTWTLSIEEQFYWIWPPIILLAPRSWVTGVCAAAIGASLAFRLAMLPMGPALARELWPPASWDALGAGAMLAATWPHARRFTPWLGAAALAAALAYAAMQTWWPDDSPVGEWAYWSLTEVLGLPVMSFLVAGAAIGFKGPAGRLLELFPMRYLGRISYGIYLYHLPVASLLDALQRRTDIWLPPHGGLRLVSYGALSVAIAALSWRVMEAPLNRLKARWPYPSKAVAPAEGMPG